MSKDKTCDHVNVFWAAPDLEYSMIFTRPDSRFSVKHGRKGSNVRNYV